MAFSGVSGNYSGNGFSGDLNLLIGEGRPKFSGKLAFDRVSAGFLGELVLGAGSIESFGVDAVGPFAAPVVTGIDVEAQLSAGQMVIGEEQPGADFSAQLNLTENTLALNELAVKLYGGSLSGNLSVRNNAGVGVFGGQLSLADAELATIGEVAGYPGLIEGRGDISANLDATAQSLDRTLAAISGNGVVSGPRHFDQWSDRRRNTDDPCCQRRRKLRNQAGNDRAARPARLRCRTPSLSPNIPARLRSPVAWPACETFRRRPMAEQFRAICNTTWRAAKRRPI